MTSTYFINISNHPSSKWSEIQLKAAQNYVEIIDWGFPTIDPQWGDSEISALADEYVKKVKLLDKSPSAITLHIMGEMTFCHALISRLRCLGYCCMASTTQRLAQEKEDGSKEVRFVFERFRKYIA